MQLLQGLQLGHLHPPAAEHVVQRQAGVFIGLHQRHAEALQGHRGGLRLAAAVALRAHREPEGGAAPGGAVDADLTAHAFHQPLADRQAQAGAALAAAGALVHLGEGVEQVLLQVRRQAVAGVGDGDLDHRLGAALFLEHGAHHDRPALGELDRVADQIGEYLANTQRIAEQAGGHVGVDDRRLLQALLLGHRRQHGLHVLDDVVQVQRNMLQRQLARLDLGEVENVVDDRQQRFGALADGAQIILLAGRQGGALQQAGEADDAVQRRADLVAHIGQELRLDLAGLERLLARHVQLDVLNLDGFQGLAQVLGGLVHVLLQLGLGLVQGRHHIAERVLQLLELALGARRRRRAQVAVAHPPHRVQQRIHRLRQPLGEAHRRHHRQQHQHHHHGDHRQHRLKDLDVLPLPGKLHRQQPVALAGQGAHQLPAGIGDQPAAAALQTLRFLHRAQPGPGVGLPAGLVVQQRGGAHVRLLQQGAQQRLVGRLLGLAQRRQTGGVALDDQLLAVGGVGAHFHHPVDQRVAADHQRRQEGGQGGHHQNARAQARMGHGSPENLCSDYGGGFSAAIMPQLASGASRPVTAPELSYNAPHDLQDH